MESEYILTVDGKKYVVYNKTANGKTFLSNFHAIYSLCDGVNFLLTSGKTRRELIEEVTVNIPSVGYNYSNYNPLNSFYFGMRILPTTEDMRNNIWAVKGEYSIANT